MYILILMCVMYVFIIEDIKVYVHICMCDQINFAKKVLYMQLFNILKY